MPKAKVSISCVTKFRTSVDEEKASAAALKSAVACVDAIVQKANSEIAKINECDNKCNLTLQTAHEKLEALQDELSELESRLAVTPETIWVSVSCGTDENGDTIYEEVEEPNPEYYALLNQISIVESKISRLESLINELESKIQQLSRTKQTYQGSITCLNNGKKDIISCCDNIIKKSDMASSQLQKAIMAIKKYLEETVHTEPVPSHTSIVWSNTGSNSNSAGDHGSSGDEILYRPKWSKIKTAHDTSVDLNATNPNYSKGEEWQVNCQRCVPTFEMLKRGYNVTASPKTEQGDYLSYNPFDVWKKPTVENTCGSGLEEIQQSMSQWGDGARAQVVVVWKGTNSGHTFTAEQREGKTYFLDPQTNESDASYYFDSVRSGYTRFCRIDNLKPSKYIKDCCKEA